MTKKIATLAAAFVMAPLAAYAIDVQSFSKIDANGNGYISSEEALNYKGPSLTGIDENGDGLISRAEFDAAANTGAKPLPTTGNAVGSTLNNVNSAAGSATKVLPNADMKASSSVKANAAGADASLSVDAATQE